MNTKFLSIVAVMLMAFSIIGCTKKNNLKPGQGYIKANISGATSQNYTSDNATSVASYANMVNTIQTTKVSLTNVGDVDAFQLMIDDSYEVGKTYNTKDIQGATLCDFVFSTTNSGDTKAWTNRFGTDNFTFTVTKRDASVIEGTFSGTMGNDDDETTITVTNGEFKGQLK